MRYTLRLLTLQQFQRRNARIRRWSESASKTAPTSGATNPSASASGSAGPLPQLQPLKPKWVNEIVALTTGTVAVARRQPATADELPMVRLTTHRRQRHRRAVQAGPGKDVPLLPRTLLLVHQASRLVRASRSSRSTKRSIDSSRPSFSPRSTNSRKCPGGDVQGLFAESVPAVSGTGGSAPNVANARECTTSVGRSHVLSVASTFRRVCRAARPDHPRRTPPDLRAARHARRALRDSGRRTVDLGAQRRRSVPRSSPPPPPPGVPPSRFTTSSAVRSKSSRRRASTPTTTSSLGNARRLSQPAAGT